LFSGSFFSFGLACHRSRLGEDPLPLTYRAELALKLKALSIEADAVKAVDDNIYFLQVLSGG